MMIATRGVKSNGPVMGIIRRRGARSGSVIRYRITASIFDEFGENQDIIARAIIATVSTVTRIWMKSIRNAITAYSPSCLALL